MGLQTMWLCKIFVFTACASQEFCTQTSTHHFEITQIFQLAIQTPFWGKKTSHKENLDLDHYETPSCWSYVCTANIRPKINTITLFLQLWNIYFQSTVEHRRLPWWSSMKFWILAQCGWAPFWQPNRNLTSKLQPSAST